MKPIAADHTTCEDIKTRKEENEKHHLKPKQKHSREGESARGKGFPHDQLAPSPGLLRHLDDVVRPPPDAGHHAGVGRNGISFETSF